MIRRWRSLLLIAAAVAPFAPLLVQAVRLGVPDTLLNGDAAVMELRTLQAAQGVQFLGPYSRFYWSHPGPAFFYLALPFYEVLGERGPALNIAALVLNIVTAVAIVLTARRLRGDAFAWMTAAALAVLELIALPLLPASSWNPLTPVLPLVLLSVLAARLALGALAVAPVFAFIASAIVQTHVGFAPVVAALVAVVAVAWGANRKGSGARRWVPITTALVLVVCWALPLYEEVVVRPGNLTELWHFFKGRNPDTHAWGVVLDTLRYQLAMMPVVAGAFIFARRHQDSVLRMLAIIAAAEVVVAIFAVRAIRGELHPYLLYWTAVPGVMTWVVAAAWVARTRWRVGVAAVAAAAASAAIAFVAPHAEWRLYDPADQAVKQVALDVEQFITSERLERPLVRLVSEDAWITTAAVLVHLQKRGIPFYVEPGWTFMFGKQNEDPGGARSRLLIGDHTFSVEPAAASGR